MSCPASKITVLTQSLNTEIETRKLKREKKATPPPTASTPKMGLQEVVASIHEIATVYKIKGPLKSFIWRCRAKLLKRKTAEAKRHRAKLERSAGASQSKIDSDFAKEIAGRRRRAKQFTATTSQKEDLFNLFDEDSNGMVSITELMSAAEEFDANMDGGVDKGEMTSLHFGTIRKARG